MLIWLLVVIVVVGASDDGRCAALNPQKHMWRDYKALHDFFDANNDNITDYEDVTSLFNKTKKLSNKQFSTITNKVLFRFCKSIAMVDKPCFKLVTEKGDYKDLFSVLDQNGDKQLTPNEVKAFPELLDLDKNKLLSRVEIAAWFTRNHPIVCRPFRKKVLASLAKTE